MYRHYLWRLTKFFKRVPWRVLLVLNIGDVFIHILYSWSDQVLLKKPTCIWLLN